MDYLERGGRWQRQAHIYESPLYYIDYCIAQACALQYRLLMEDDFEGAWKDYIELSKKGGRIPLTALLAESKLASPFGDEFFETLALGAGKILARLREKCE